jgi:hypothetical protein
MPGMIEFGDGDADAFATGHLGYCDANDLRP